MYKKVAVSGVKNDPPADANISQDAIVGVTIWEVSKTSTGSAAHARMDDSTDAWFSKASLKFTDPELQGAPPRPAKAAPVPAPKPSPQVIHPPQLPKANSSFDLRARRTSADHQFGEGDQLRIGIESPTKGYLYIIDRELYADGSYGKAMLVFPTKRMNGGDNVVSGGRLITYPALTDDPPYLVFVLQRADQVAETLTILITPEPLSDMEIGEQAMEVPESRLKFWESRWLGKSEHYARADDQGARYTQREVEASSDNGVPLTQADALPHEIYRVLKASGSPILLNINLQIKKPTQVRAAD